MDEQIVRIRLKVEAPSVLHSTAIKYITDPELKSVQLCFEVHGQLGNHYNLISDWCTSVTALHSVGVVGTAMNSTLLTYGTHQQCQIYDHIIYHHTTWYILY